jgi:hypothetical protein
LLVFETDHPRNHLLQKPCGKKIEKKSTICHEKLLLKTLWENKEKMTYIIHACTDIASLKTLHEKPLEKTHKGKECNIEDRVIFNRL